MSNGILMGNTWGNYLVTESLTPTSITAATTASQTFTLPGLKVTDFVDVGGPAPTAGTGIVGSRCSAANTLQIDFINTTAGTLTPVAGAYGITISRPTGGQPATAIGD